MNYYGAKELAASFRTVRKNTLMIADEIPEAQYNFKAAEGFRSVSQLLTHIALSTQFQEEVNLVEKRSTLVGFDFMSLMGRIETEAAKPRTKAEIVTLLNERGEKWATAIEPLSDEFLGESVMLPPGASPATRTRFDMLASVKEHEMHHRGQLMLIERMLGITPHLTRDQLTRMAAMREAAAKA